MLLLFWRGVGAPAAALIGRRVRRRKYHVRYDRAGGAVSVEAGRAVDPLPPWPDGRPALDRLEADLSRLEARQRRRKALADDDEDALHLILLHV